MSRSKYELSRRTVLRGLGAAVALPLLDAMAPAGGSGSMLGRLAAAAAEPAAVAPRRMAMFFVPNGMNLDAFTPAAEGALGELPRTLKPLAAVKDKITVLTGLTQDNARAKGDGGGDHARSSAAFLTGAHPYKTSGSNLKIGVSVDQVAAQRIGSATRLPSLELGLDRGALAGNCDSGYACAYVSNIAWRNETTPVPKEVNPAAVFERLFGSTVDREAAEGRAKRLRYRKSVLDFVAADAKRLDRRLGKSDQRKLDEFTTAIREIEKRCDLDRAQQAELKKMPEYARPEGVPDDLPEHMRLMSDLLVLAFQMDVTRVSTFMVAQEGSNRTFRSIGVNDGHHVVSHHGGDAEKLEAIRKIDLHHVTQFAYFLEKMNAVKEGEGTLLDNSMVMFGSGISDGNRHNHDNLPILLAGRGGGSLAPGRHVRYPKNTPLCNLYVSMLDRMGVKADRFGDSSGPLAGLTA
jgi:hypothetical protein